MSIFNVSIYIETTIKGPRPRMAAGAWLAEYITSQNEPKTREGKLFCERTTENALTLALLSEALDSLARTCTCSIRVNTECRHVVNAVKKGWVEQWKKNGWMNAKGVPVKNVELWQQVSEKMERHLVAFDLGDHSYRKMMRDGIHRILDAEERKRAGTSSGKEKDGKHTDHQAGGRGRRGLADRKSVV